MKKYLPEAVLIFFSICGILLYGLGWKTLLTLTPLYLVGSIYLAYRRATGITKYTVLPLAMAGFIGFGFEVVGVNTGIVFGNYQYGGTLGPSLWGTPLLMILLWAFIPWLVWSVFSEKVGLYTIPLAGFLAVIYDVPLEFFAIRTGLWNWQGGIPLSNYVTWFIVTCIASSFLFYFRAVRIPRVTALVVLCTHILFFTTFLLLY